MAISVNAPDIGWIQERLDHPSNVLSVLPKLMSRYALSRFGFLGAAGLIGASIHRDQDVDTTAISSRQHSDNSVSFVSQHQACADDSRWSTKHIDFLLSTFSPNLLLRTALAEAETAAPRSAPSHCVTDTTSAVAMLLTAPIAAMLDGLQPSPQQIRQSLELFSAPGIMQGLEIW